MMTEGKKTEKRIPMIRELASFREKRCQESLWHVWQRRVVNEARGIPEEETTKKARRYF